jgi:hypothetical protein
MAAVAVIPVRIGDNEILVQTVPVAGSEPTSRLGTARDRAVGAFDRARQSIMSVAEATVDMAAELSRRSARPEKVEVEFGLKFTAQGNVIVAGGSGEAALLVRLTFPGTPPA